MKRYEKVPCAFLTPRMPMIIRVDGKAFHTYTRGMEKPWDLGMRDAMTATAQALVQEISGAKLAYIQSDEISILATDYDALGTQAWFDKNVQKIVSVSASIATMAFNRAYANSSTRHGRALFDARCFVLPQEEVCNYFLWRQQDASRNSISGLAQANFSHKQLHGVNTGGMQDMLMLEKNINWNDCEVWQKRGWCVRRVTELYEPEPKDRAKVLAGKVSIVAAVAYQRTEVRPDWDIPIFSKDRDYINQHVVLHATD